MLRRVSVTNSSSSLPVWSDEPMTMAPAAASGVYVLAPLWKNSGGLRNPLSSDTELSTLAPEASTFSRATVSSSIEWPKR